MKRAMPSLQIRIHKVNGTSATFTQNSTGEATSILEEFHPDQTFCRDRITLADHDSVTSFPVSQITRIDLTCEQLPHLVFPVGMVAAVELAEAEFQTLVRNPIMRNQWEQLVSSDASLVTFMEMEMADGERLFLVTETPAEAQSRLWKSKGIPLDGTGLCFRMRNGGVAVLNLAHMTRAKFLPKPGQTHADTWPAQQIKSSPAVAGFASGNSEPLARVNSPKAPFFSPHDQRLLLNKTNMNRYENASQMDGNPS